MAARPREPASKATATTFADWVFHKLNPGHRAAAKTESTQRMRWSGQYGHEEIERLKSWLQRNRHIARLSHSFGEWKCVYADPPDRADAHVFQASCLWINGSPMRCRPDVVLRDEKTGRVIILERKVTHTVREREHYLAHGYLSHWCQAWCYAWIDDWLNAPDVLLVLQYWYRDWSRSNWAKRLDDFQPVKWRSSRQFHSEILRLFREYGGAFRGHPDAGSP